MKRTSTRLVSVLVLASLVLMSFTNLVVAEEEHEALVTASVSEAAPGKRQLAVRDTGGDPLPGLDLQPGAAHPFVTVVEDELYNALSDFEVQARLTDLYRVQDDAPGDLQDVTDWASVPFASYFTGDVIPSARVAARQPLLGAVTDPNGVLELPRLRLAGVLDGSDGCVSDLTDQLTSAGLIGALLDVVNGLPLVGGLIGGLIGGTVGSVTSNELVTGICEALGDIDEHLHAGEILLEVDVALDALLGTLDAELVPLLAGLGTTGAFADANCTKGIASSMGAPCESADPNGTPVALMHGATQLDLAAVDSLLADLLGAPLGDLFGASSPVTITLSQVEGGLNEVGGAAANLWSLIDGLTPSQQNDLLNILFDIDRTGLLEDLRLSTDHRNVPRLQLDRNVGDAVPGTYAGTMTVTLISD
jgi:hypothetical protein